MEMEKGDPRTRMQDYEVLEQIGSGSCSATFLVLHTTENKRYVLKKISLSKQTEKFKRTASQEVQNIAKLRHQYILEYKDAWVDEGNCICILTSYCEHGNILQIIRKAKGAYFPEEIVSKWLAQMLLTIDFIHSNRVLHGDLKLSNIFVTKENDIRLGDFGLSKLLDGGDTTGSAVGTPNYVFPELLAGAPYGYKSDIWSLGCCFFEIVAHQPAFKASDMAGLINKINRSLISPIPIIYSPTLKQIIKSMLRKNTEHRPTAAELLRHPHLQSFLLHCHNPSPTFLPVKSPSPKNIEKKLKTSPASTRIKEAKPKPKELLPLFDETKNLQLPNLLDSDASLETKRVDRTSYSGKISTDSEDSKSAGYGDDASSIANCSSLKRSGDLSLIETASFEDDKCNSTMVTAQCSIDASERDESLAEDSPVSLNKSSTPNDCISKDHVFEKVDVDEERARLVSYAAVSVSESESKEGKPVKPVPQRADALESLLELCAELLKQEKLDELTGILKPFGDETVSSRETAIWLTKSLMNAKKMARQG